MISLKKYLEMDVKTAPASAPDELLRVTLDAYRAALQCVGESGARACPVMGSDLQQSMAALADGLVTEVTVALVAQTGTQAAEQLQQWGDRTADYFKTRTAEVKELLLALARTAESIGERDHRYTDNLNQFTTKLRTIGTLEDLTQVRASLVQQATELKTYVTQMENDSQQLVSKLQTDVSAYETRLKKVEELASRDTLTGLANRRGVEERIESRIAMAQTFCVVLLDLNRLKLVNDKHGHLAGDSVLQQFAQELRSSSRASDLVGRWGGDEFLAVMDGDTAGANAQIERLKKWVFGKYTIRPGKGAGEVEVHVDAAIGVAEWQPGETMKTVIERADAEMYKQKEAAKKQKP